MKKRVIALVAAALLIMPQLVLGNSNTAEDLVPSGTLFTADFSVSGKLKELINDFMSSHPITDETSTEKPKADLVLQQILDGKRFFISAGSADYFSLIFPLSDEQWKTFVGSDQKETYGSSDVYNSGSQYFTRIGGFVVLGSTADAVHQAIDLANGKATNSLSSDSSYMGMAGKFLSPRLFGFRLKLNDLITMFVSAMGGGDSDPKTKALQDIISMIDAEGGSFASKGNGYSFTYHVAGNKSKIDDQGFSFGAGGIFTPNLYMKFPGAKVIMYSESFNPKAELPQTKKILSQLSAGEGDIMAILKENLGFDLEEIMTAFDQELAVGVQYDSNSQLPYFTVMGNVKNNPIAGKKLTDDLVNTITHALTNSDHDIDKSTYHITTAGPFSKITFDFKQDDGPPFSPVTLTIGVTNDGLLIISTFPGIDDAGVRSGIGADPDFASYMNQMNNISSMTYLNVRNIFGYVDSLTAWIDKVGGAENGLPLSFYETYYPIVDNFYKWKDLFMTTKADQYNVDVAGSVTVDEATHANYQDFVNNLKLKDTNNDGVNDFQSRFLYHLPDNSDAQYLEKLKAGANPTGEGQIFSDLPADAYYTQDVSLLWQQNAISGYPDKTFKPGREVNRAEFVAMVMKTFHLSGRAGYDYMPFGDVPSDAWYYNPVSLAYSRGIVSGSYNKKTGETEFRPGDPITRAEAIAILNKASKSLSKTLYVSGAYTGCSDIGANSSAFSDVHTEDWFCNQVMNGYSAGITKGKVPGQFKPFDHLTRAEAAVMMRRSQEHDLQLDEEHGGSLEDVGQSLSRTLNTPGLIPFPGL